MQTGKQGEDMADLIINYDEYTNSEMHTVSPLVVFKAITGDCLLAGESYSDNTWKFYEPV